MPGRFTRSHPTGRHALVTWATLVAVVGLVMTDFVLSIITPDYDVVRETSSQLMNPDARYQALARAALGIHAALLLPLLSVIGNRIGAGQLRSGLITTAFSVYIGASIVSAVAANDSDSKLIGDLTANQVHDLAAIVMFSGAFATVAGALTGVRSLAWSTQIATYAAFTVLVIGGPVFLAEVVTEINGVLERILALTFVAWLGVIAWGEQQPAKRP